MPRHSVRASISKPFLPIKRALALPKAERGISSDSIHVQLARALVVGSYSPSSSSASSASSTAPSTSSSSSVPGSPITPSAISPPPEYSVSPEDNAQSQQQQQATSSAPVSPKNWPLPPTPHDTPSTTNPTKAPVKHARTRSLGTLPTTPRPVVLADQIPEESPFASRSDTVRHITGLGSSGMPRVQRRPRSSSLVNLPSALRALDCLVEEEEEEGEGESKLSVQPLPSQSPAVTGNRSRVVSAPASAPFKPSKPLPTPPSSPRGKATSHSPKKTSSRPLHKPVKHIPKPHVHKRTSSLSVLKSTGTSLAPVVEEEQRVPHLWVEEEKREHEVAIGEAPTRTYFEATKIASVKAASTLPEEKVLHLPRDESEEWQYIKVKIRHPTSETAQQPHLVPEQQQQQQRKRTPSFPSHYAFQLFSRAKSGNNHQENVKTDVPSRPVKSSRFRRASTNDAVMVPKSKSGHSTGMAVKEEEQEGSRVSLDLPRSPTSVDQWSQVLHQAIGAAQGDASFSSCSADLSLEMENHDDSGIGMLSTDDMQKSEGGEEEELLPNYLLQYITRSASRHLRRLSCPDILLTPSSSNALLLEATMTNFPAPSEHTKKESPRSVRRKSVVGDLRADHGGPDSSTATTASRSRTSSRRSSTTSTDKESHYSTAKSSFSSLWPPPSDLLASLLPPAPTSRPTVLPNPSSSSASSKKAARVSFSSPTTTSTYTFTTDNSGLEKRTFLQLRPRDLNTDLEVKPWMVVAPRFVLDDAGVGVRDWDRDRLEHGH